MGNTFTTSPAKIFLLLSLASLLFLMESCSWLNLKNRSPEEAEDAQQTVKIAMSDEPSSLDPRLVRDLPTASLLHMLYEGLMRTDYDGKTIPGLAKEVQISSDKKTYTFTLRSSFWSNGDSFTADAFVDTWKTILDPAFPAPNAYQFFIIKGAKEAKLGQISFDKVGIYSPNKETLVIELVEPTPYFLKLVSTHFFYPVYSPKAEESGEQKAERKVEIIGNGPFKLEQWAHNDALTFKKNEQFWDAAEVHLKKIVVTVLDEHTALLLYENRELSWAGSPLGTIPQDAVATLKARHQLHILPAAGTQWCRFNTEKIPFTNRQMRRAFSLVLDREALVTHVTQGNQKPAMAIVPPSFALPRKAYFEDNDSPQAWESFQNALEGLALSVDDLPEITLSYASNDRNHKIAQAIQQYWYKGLGINVKLQGKESKVFLDNVKTGNYQIALGSWYADIPDPTNFLDLFQSKTNPTNLTNWENPKYSELLKLSSQESNPHERLITLGKAEDLLMQEMPVAPLFFAAFNYVKSPTLVGVIFSELGTLDFTYAFHDE